MRDMGLDVQCMHCGDGYRIDVSSDDYARWKGGEYAQVVFPYLDADERELLISQTCPVCWKRMFGTFDE